MLAHPERLWLLALLPPLAWVAARGEGRRRRGWAELGQPGLPSRGRPRLSVGALVALIGALAEPRWGRTEGPPLPPGQDLVIVVDVSRSMGAMDAVPDRLGVAVEAAEGLALTQGRSAGDRVAVVAFAGRGVLRCPLTTDAAAAVAALRALRPGGVRPGGSDLGAGLDAALDAFDDLDRAGGRSVVVFSDGEDHAGRWPESAARLAARGVIVHAVAVGDDARGHPVPVQRADTSRVVRFEGREVESRRSDAALSAVARETGGAFVPLGLASVDLGALYRTRIAPVARARRALAQAPELAAWFGPFLVAALVLALAACRPAPARRAQARTIAFALAVVAMAPGTSPQDDPAAAVAEGRSAYAGGRFADALDAFRRAERLAPGSPVPAYDAASALFRLGRFGEARGAYLKARALAGEDALLRAKIDFALGNTAVALGDLSEALARYDACLASRASGPEADRVRDDAAANRRFIEEQAARAPTPEKGASAPSADPRQDPSGADGDRPGPAGGVPGPAEPGGSAPGRRGPGGAGGSGPPAPAPGSPEARLAEALENVRRARDARLGDQPAGDEHPDGVRDW